MDEFERRLKEDAEAIDVTVSPALEQRIAASVHAVGAPAPAKPPERRFDLRWWFFSTLTGAAAVLLVVVAANWPGRGNVPAEPPTEPPTIAATPGAGVTATPDPSVSAGNPPLLQPLDVRTAEFADPLSQELEAIKSDLEKARSELEDDLRFTF